MERDRALGFIETVGLVSAIAAADAALKAANVELIGREISKGQGCVTIKITGEVSAVQAAIGAARTAASSVSSVLSTDVIPRPAAGLGDVMVRSKETTLGPKNPGKDSASPHQPEEIPEAKNIEESGEPSKENLPEEPISDSVEPVPAVESAAEERAPEVQNTAKKENVIPKNGGQQNKQGKRKSK
jgi:microcompartment protein CcmL/EutN